MIPLHILQQIKRIEIRTKRLVNDLFGGAYHSAFKGQGMEFEEVREYIHGDDMRLIDWNVTARMGAPYVKKFKEERELNVMLLIDASSSGQFGTRLKFKNTAAAELCAVVAGSAMKNNDKVGMAFFTDHIESYVPPAKGRGHVFRLIEEILSFQPSGRHTDIGQALEFFNKVSRRKSVVFLVSDFMGEGFLKPLRIIGRKHDMIAVKVTDPRELTFEDVGIIELEDSETGEIVAVDTGSWSFRQEFAARAAEDVEALRQSFRRIGLDFIEIRSDKPFVTPLMNFFRARGQRR